MADNILTKDRDNANIAIAAKGVAGVLTPRNMLQNAAGTDINPATQETVAALALESGGNLATLAARTPALGQATMANSRPVVIASNQGNVPVAPAAQATSGSMAALNAAVSLTLNGAAGAIIDLRGTFVATVSFQGTVDGTNYFSLPATPASSSNNVASVTTATVAGAWYVQAAGCLSIRATATAYTSGTVTATLRAVTAVPWVYSAPVGATTVVSGTVTATVTGATQLPVTPTQSFVNSAATTNATSTKASAGTVWSVVVSNINAAVRYLKLYNKASAPTVGTDVPVLTIAIPAGGVAQVDGGSNGLRFGTGIAWALTTGSADTDTAAVAASEIKVSIAYT